MKQVTEIEQMKRFMLFDINETTVDSWHMGNEQSNWDRSWEYVNIAELTGKLPSLWKTQSYAVLHHVVAVKKKTDHALDFPFFRVSHWVMLKTVQCFDDWQMFSAPFSWAPHWWHWLLWGIQHCPTVGLWERWTGGISTSWKPTGPAHTHAGSRALQQYRHNIQTWQGRDIL